ncbi:hypothetical protein KOW79_015867 [Hemibagrus wyckioides]|uniref:Claudin n=1 Tax=Hemibagrus wyckioides TaxID=337641 RepID=A0A9D3NIL5_9TELE|nr:hypothetical protein KOW79_015867 [Hemibagrus wyckioides]
MASSGLQILGLALAFLGLLGDIVICALPMWRVTAFIGQNIVTAQTFWEGLWMNCVMQSTGQMQCKVYDSMLALPQDLQAARALVVISILLTLFGLLLAVAGGKCTNCIEDEATKARVSVAAGVFFLVGGVLCLIPVCWSAHTVILDFYNPTLADAQKRELGASLFIGWGAAALLLLGGALFCCQCPKNDHQGAERKRLGYLTEMGQQLLATFLALLGFVGTILVAALPMWKMSAFLGANIVTAQIFWEGLWMNCVLQSTGHMQCKAYDSILALPQYLQGTRALICFSLATAVVAIGLMVVGARCTNFFRDDWNKKAKIGIVAGVVYIIAGILCLIAVSWSAHIIIQGFYNPQVIAAGKGELGACIYIGWVAGFLLVLGGGLFISTYSNSC